MIFADDTQIYYQCRPSDAVASMALVSHDIRIIADYATVNGLTLNIAKSKIMIIGSNPYVRDLDFSAIPPTLISTFQIPMVDNARNPGVHLSSNLTWNSHISHISQRIHASLHKLKFHKNLLSTQLRIKLVSTLLFPYFDYCCLVYHNLSDELNTKLQRLLNTCIRFIFNLRRDAHITPYRHQLKWLSVKNRRLYFLGIQTYQILNLKSPSYLRELFIPRPSDTTRPPRYPLSPYLLYIPNHRTTTYRNSFHLSAVYC